MNEIQGKNVIVTGGAGFIGSSLVRLLLSEGAKVTVIDNLINGKKENLTEVAADINFIQADIRNTDAFSKEIKQADTIFHLACLGVRHSIHSPMENHDVNATATLGLLDACYKAGVSRFVYTSTSEIYGTSKWVPMTEDHPANPHTVYGGGKYAGECYTRAYWNVHQYPTSVVRPFNSFGPRSHHEGDSGEVIPKFILRAKAGEPLIVFGNGSQTRDFTYVMDTAKGIMRAGFSDSAIGQIINIGYGREITINELAQTILRLTGSSSTIVYEEPRPGDVLRLFADSEKSHTLLGYRPEHTLEQGLAKLLEWYDAQGTAPELLLQAEKIKNWTK